MPTAEAPSTADLRREVQTRSNELAGKQNQLLALMTSTRNEEGERVIQPHQALQIRDLESQCATLTDQVNALKMDYVEARTREELDRNGKAPLAPRALFPEEGGVKAAGAAGAIAGKHPVPDSLGEALIESAGYQRWVHGGQAQSAFADVAMLGIKSYAIKAPLTTTTGPTTAIDKLPELVRLGQQELTIADLLSTGQTNSTTIRYIQEDSFTNAAGMVAEGTAKPEQTYDISEVDAAVKKIGVWSKITDEMWADQTAVRDYVNAMIPFGVRRKEEDQLLNGDGTGNNLLGLASVSGTLTQAMTGNNIDTIYLAITKVRTVGFFEPDAVVIHPNNWSAIRLAKTTQGEYVYGDPWTPGPESIFGKRVVVTANATANTAWVGAWRIGGQIFYRMGIQVQATNTDQDDFIKNLVTVRGEERLTVCWFRPKAFCSCTGLTV